MDTTNQTGLQTFKPTKNLNVGECLFTLFGHIYIFRLWLSYKNIDSEYWEGMAWLTVPRKFECNVVNN